MSPPDLLLLSPLRGEIEPVLDELFGAGRPVPVPEPGKVWRYDQDGRCVLAGWTGVGRRATEAALESLAEHAPRAVVHLGVAGGLRSAQRAGDALLVEQVWDEDGGEAEHETPAGLRAAFLGAGLRVGGSVTVRQVAGEPAAKRALAARYPRADVVEMETVWVARSARALGLPCALLRVVCDGLDEQLPDLSPALDATGRPKPWAFAKHLARHPGTMLRLPGLAGAFAKAQRALARWGRVALAAGAQGGTDG